MAKDTCFNVLDNRPIHPCSSVADFDFEGISYKTTSNALYTILNELTKEKRERYEGSLNHRRKKERTKSISTIFLRLAHFFGFLKFDEINVFANNSREGL